MFGDITDVVGMLDRRKFSDFNVEDNLIASFAVQEKMMTQFQFHLTWILIWHDNARYCHIVGDGGTLRWMQFPNSLNSVPSGNVEEVYSNSNDLKLSSVNMWNAFIDRDISRHSLMFLLQQI